jgi:hypothetical protein
MSKKYVISRNLLPIKSPVGAMWLTALTMYTFNAPSWLWGVWGTLSLILIIAFIVERRNEEEIDIKINK